MSYLVKEIFKTLQGEGAQAGRTSVFCRFTGCNLWSGREIDRATATCRFCDTNFVGTDGDLGGRYLSASDLTKTLADVWDGIPEHQFVVFTGGEPLLQLDQSLIDATHARGFEIAIETNGTLRVPEGIDWVCVSPKATAPLHQRSGDELKLVYPQVGLSPEDVAALPFTHFWLQPMDGPNLATNTNAAIAYCLAHPKWRLSLQTQKLIGIP